MFSVSFSFPRRARLAKRFEFQAVQQSGQKHHTKYFLIFTLPNSLHHARLGITVTKKIGSAVRRNKLKRLVREVFRLNPKVFSRSTDIVVIAKHSAATADSEGLRADFLNWAQRQSQSDQT